MTMAEAEINYSELDRRLQSFTTWGLLSPSARDLAEAGFIYLGKHLSPVPLSSPALIVVSFILSSVQNAWILARYFAVAYPGLFPVIVCAM